MIVVNAPSSLEGKLLGAKFNLNVIKFGNNDESLARYNKLELIKKFRFL